MVKKQLWCSAWFMSKYTPLMFEYITLCSVKMSLSFYINPSENFNLYFLIQTNAHVWNSCGFMWIKYSTHKCFLKKAADVFVSLLINIIGLCLTAGLVESAWFSWYVCLANDDNVARHRIIEDVELNHQILNWLEFMSKFCTIYKNTL